MLTKLIMSGVPTIDKNYPIVAWLGNTPVPGIFAGTQIRITIEVEGDEQVDTSEVLRGEQG